MNMPGRTVMNYWTLSPKKIWVAAHRGNSTDYPENTIPAFEAAIGAGVDQIELDVRVTYDGELVVIHDATVNRTTNGTGKVCEKTLAEIKSLDAGSYKGEQFVGTRIPTFVEFMELVKDHPTLTLDIELKEYPTTPGNEVRAYEVADKILALVDEYGYTDRVVINSFSNPLNEYIFKKYGKKYRQHVYYPINCLSGPQTLDPYSYAYCTCMFRAFYSKLNMATRVEFKAMEELGPQPWAGACVKDEEGVDAAIESGAYLITCNNPDVILDLLRKKGYHN
jgi:glycerophosphoryl diester phosphodiesterase